jgi:hypothetical protein
MNKHIKLLKEQAMEWVPNRVDPDTKIRLLNAEKFALLIVQECIDLISPYTVSMNRPGEEYLHPILEIKQHFGVEE